MKKIIFVLLLCTLFVSGCKGDRYQATGTFDLERVIKMGSYDPLNVACTIKRGDKGTVVDTSNVCIGDCIPVYEVCVDDSGCCGWTFKDVPAKKIKE